MNENRLTLKSHIRGCTDAETAVEKMNAASASIRASVETRDNFAEHMKNISKLPLETQKFVLGSVPKPETALDDARITTHEAYKSVAQGIVNRIMKYDDAFFLVADEKKLTEVSSYMNELSKIVALPSKVVSAK